jgi:hypothetical protein
MDVPQLQQMVEFLQGQVQTYQQYIQSGQQEMLMQEAQRKNQESEAKAMKDIEQSELYEAQKIAQQIENDMLESGVMELLEGEAE